MKNCSVLTISFETNSNEAQAKIILDKVREIHGQGYSKVGITYSANQEQTEKIYQTYSKGDWYTSTSGANQAAVICTVEKLLRTEKYKDLQTVFRIIPITTMDYRENRSTAKDSDVRESLEKATRFVNEGNYLLGWANQLTENTIAIGGGVASSIQTSQQKKMIQEWIDSVFFKKSLTNNVQNEAQKKPVNETLVSSVNIIQPNSANELFAKKLQLLQNKMNHLQKRRDQEPTNTSKYKELNEAYNAANLLKNNLTRAGDAFFKNPTKNQQQIFIQSCDQYLKTAHQQLDKHRGWSEFLVNLALGLTTAGIGLLLKGAINVSQNRSFFFVHQTDSTKLLDDIEETIKKEFK